jgi:hypothetical protein
VGPKQIKNLQQSEENNQQREDLAFRMEGKFFQPFTSQKTYTQ